MVYTRVPVPRWLYMHGPCEGTLVYNPCAPGRPLYTPLGDSPIQLIPFILWFFYARSFQEEHGGARKRLEELGVSWSSQEHRRIRNSQKGLYRRAPQWCI